MDEEITRQKAIELFLHGHKPASICRELGKTRPWFYKWLKRYQQNPKEEWYKEYSRKPKTVHPTLSPETEQLILKIRKDLESKKYAQIGAISIQWAFHQLGLNPPPIWTIDRVLKRHGLTRKKKKEPKRTNEYPGDKYINVQQLDLVGPRFIKDYGRFYAANMIDLERRCIHTNPVKSKASDHVVRAVCRFWKTFGIPDFLQMDNEMSFRGSNRYPHSFGKLIRFALLHQVTPIFIPQAEPWRNGVIEQFNETFDKKFFRSQRFKDLAHIRQEAQRFENFHNSYYRYKAIGNRTPCDMLNRFPFFAKLAPRYKIPRKLPLIDGKIIFIRFIRSNLKLNVLGESFRVATDLIYSYVEAVVSIEGQSLSVYRDNRLFNSFEYKMPVDWM